MDKTVGYAGLDPDLAARLCRTLADAPEPGAAALLARLTELREGRAAALLLELDGAPAAGESVFRCGEVEIRPAARQVLRAGREIPLTPKEFDILWFLARNRGQVFTKEQIYRAVWEADYLLDDSNIMAFIRKLRKKLEPDPDDPAYILTIWGIGYKFREESSAPREG